MTSRVAGSEPTPLIPETPLPPATDLQADEQSTPQKTARATHTSRAISANTLPSAATCRAIRSKATTESSRMQCWSAQHRTHGSLRNQTGTGSPGHKHHRMCAPASSRHTPSRSLLSFQAHVYGRTDEGDATPRAVGWVSWSGELVRCRRDRRLEQSVDVAGRCDGLGPGTIRANKDVSAVCSGLPRGLNPVRRSQCCCGE
jgi:hypothetical protein